MSQFITITSENQGQRLDRFLAEQLKDITRSQIKKMIKSGQVLVNGKSSSVHHFLKQGDIISISFDRVAASLARSSDSKTVAYADKIKYEPKIVHDSSDFLIIDKPMGLLVHPVDKNLSQTRDSRSAPTLVDWLLKKYPDLKNVGGQAYRAGLIHRLDKDVSGIMVIAKTPAAYEHLKNQFKNRKVDKEYIALVYGQIQQPEGKINLPIGRGKDGQFVAHPRIGKNKFQPTDKVAKTEYKVLEYIKDYTLLQVKILTGRTHQIRAHFSAIGHPILGDHIYKPKNKFLHFLRRRIKVVDPGRIFLHSQKIGFYDLNNQWVEFTSPLPQKLTNYLNEIKN